MGGTGGLKDTVPLQNPGTHDPGSPLRIRGISPALLPFECEFVGVSRVINNQPLPPSFADITSSASLYESRAYALRVRIGVARTKTRGSGGGGGGGRMKRVWCFHSMESHHRKPRGGPGGGREPKQLGIIGVQLHARAVKAESAGKVLFSGAESPLCVKGGHQFFFHWTLLLRSSLFPPNWCLVFRSP